MTSIWVKWPISTFDYTEVTINDVVGEVSIVPDKAICEARAELHGDKFYIVHTKHGPYVLCHRCCKTLGLPLPPNRRFHGKS